MDGYSNMRNRIEKVDALDIYENTKYNVLVYFDMSCYALWGGSAGSRDCILGEADGMLHRFCLTKNG